MFDPFAAWTRMAATSASMTASMLRMSETLSASQTVIDKRTTLMRSALDDPLSTDVAELSRMVPEKVAAFSSAGSAVMAGWVAWNDAVLAEARHVGKLAARGRALSPADWMTLWSRGASFGVATPESAARVGAAALAPVHAKATSNARRLNKRKR